MSSKPPLCFTCVWLSIAFAVQSVIAFGVGIGGYVLHNPGAATVACVLSLVCGWCSNRIRADWRHPRLFAESRP